MIAGEDADWVQDIWGVCLLCLGGLGIQSNGATTKYIVFYDRISVGSSI